MVIYDFFIYIAVPKYLSYLTFNTTRIKWTYLGTSQDILLLLILLIKGPDWKVWKLHTRDLKKLIANI